MTIDKDLAVPSAPPSASDIPHPLRVLRVITRLNVGGPAQHVIFLTERFRRRGWESALLTGQEGAGEDTMLGLARSRGMEPVLIPEMGREIHPLRDLVALWKITRMMFRFRPEVVHTHTAKAGTLGRGAAAIYRRAHRRGLWRPRPLVVFHTFHGHVLQGYFSPAKERFFLRVERALARLTTSLITLSPFLRAQLSEMGIAPPDHIRVIPLGLELDKFFALPERSNRPAPLRRELGLSPETPLVGIVGRMVPIKDHATFIEAASLLTRQSPGARSSDAHFLIVGDGELRQAAEALARRHGIFERCHFLGWRSDLPDIYAAADLVVLTSRNEGTPLSLIEAMAAGRPVVATAVGGVPDLVGGRGDIGRGPIPPGSFRRTTAGLLAGAGDAAGVAAAIAHLLETPPLARELALAGRRLAGKYAIDRLVEDLMRLYWESWARSQGDTP